MAFLDPRIWARGWAMFFTVVFVVRGFSMLEILVIILVVGGLALFAAVKFTEGPTDFSEDI